MSAYQPQDGEAEQSHVRVNTHINLHVDALLKVKHDALDARFEILPSRGKSALNSSVPVSTHQEVEVAYVAPISSLLGIDGILVGGCCARATVDAITLFFAMVSKGDGVTLVVGCW